MKRHNCYTITEIARELDVTRQTIYYWIKKKWVKPKRDYRNYPVFTKNDLTLIKKWHNSFREPTGPSKKKNENQQPPPHWTWQDLQSQLFK